MVVESKKGKGFVAYAIPLPSVNVWTQMMYYRAIHTEHKQFLGQITKIFTPQTVLEQFFCKKLQKKCQPRNWFWEYGTFRGVEWSQIEPKWLRVSLMLIWDQFDIFQNLQMSPAVSWLGLFLPFHRWGQGFPITLAKMGVGMGKLKLLMFFVYGLDPFLEWEQPGLH